MRLLAVSVLVSLVISLAGASGSGAGEYEVPRNRVVTDILPQDMISGPHYRIRDKVVSYGYMHYYTVDSDYGVFEVTGDGALRKLLNEIRAITVLKEIQASKAYLDSVANAAKMPAEFGKNLITDPADTISGIPKGIYGLFSRIGTSLSSPKDPSEDSRLKAALAVSSYKREYAYELGVDVYSSNSVLQKELNRLGWAGAVGSLSVSAALLPFGGPGALAFKYTRLAQQFNNLLKEEPPARLRQINGEKLAAMGVPSALANEFLDHPDLTPRHDTVIVGSLAEMKGARGQEIFIEFACQATNEVDANFFMQMAETMRGYHETVSPIREITTVVSPFLLARAANGVVLIPFPLDHGVWSERAAERVGEIIRVQKASGAGGKLEVWMTGTISALARQQLERFGIQPTENVDQRIEFMD